MTLPHPGPRRAALEQGYAPDVRRLHFVYVGLQSE
jgi:hypothetical protein